MCASGRSAFSINPSLSYQSLRDKLIESILDLYFDEPDEPQSEADWLALYTDAFAEVLESHNLIGSRSADQIRRFMASPNDSPDRWRCLIPQVQFRRRSSAERFYSSIPSEEAFQAILGYRPLLPISDSEAVAPIVKYAELVVVDRREIEGFRAIQRLMNQHILSVENEQNARPLCLAVFGPPGSGKSYAVKKINESLAKRTTKVLEPFNLGQFTSVKELEDFV